MMHQENLLLAIKQSKISKIAVIDDAFDLPTIDDKNAGGLLESFEHETFKAIAAEAEIAGKAVDDAVAALQNSQYGDEKLLAVLEALYQKFGESFDDRFNPGGIFGHQVANMKHLAPVMRLLNICKPQPRIVKYGSSLDDLSDAKDVELIFIDAFLDPLVSPESATKAEKNAAWKNSLDKVSTLVRSLGENAPSVILMSSSAQVRKDAEKYRKDIQGEKQKGLVFASRFGFLEKTRLTLLDEGKIGVEEDAADDLLDIFQSYQFGRSMHTALEGWLASAEKATTEMRADLERLHLKDFAYLVRFRLQEEGQSLVEYLDWFFGECLLDTLGKKIDEVTGSEETVSFLNEKGAEQIEGAYEGATATVADLYDRVRIESPRKIRKGEYRLGDLYMSGRKTIYATMTPDCDLVRRPSGDRGARQILMVVGEVHEFDAPKTTVADFIMIGGKPRNIKWDAKKLETFEFNGFPEKQDLKYVGTLRPLYAQELQRRVLHDLGRVGVATAPAIGIRAAVSVHVLQKAGERKRIELADGKGADCTIMPGRGGSAIAKALFGRRFAPTLLNALTKLDPAELAAHAAEQIDALKKDGSRKKLEKMYKNGVACEEAIAFGINLTANKEFKGKSDKTTWCWILIEMGEEILVETLEVAG